MGTPIPGTIVAAAITTGDTDNTHAITYANEQQGGVHSVADQTAREAITTARRIQGMLVYQQDNGITYQLAGGITNDDWVVFPRVSMGLELYLMDDASTDIAGYKQLVDDFIPGTEASITGSSLGTGNHLLEEFATESGVPGLSFIHSGVVDLHIHANKVGAGTKTARLYFELYKYETDTTETLLTTSEYSNVLTTTSGAYELHVILGDTIVDITDRIVVKIYANISGSGGDPDVVIYYEGDDATRLTLPVTSSGGAGTGDVTGPASSVNNAIVTFNGTTGKLIQDNHSGRLTVSDDGTLIISAPASGNALTITGLNNQHTINSIGCGTGMALAGYNESGCAVYGCGSVFGGVFSSLCGCGLIAQPTCGVATTAYAGAFVGGPNAATGTVIAGTGLYSIGGQATGATGVTLGGHGALIYGGAATNATNADGQGGVGACIFGGCSYGKVAGGVGLFVVGGTGCTGLNYYSACFKGNTYTCGTVCATNGFYGVGTVLTALCGTEICSGTINTARLPNTISVLTAVCSATICGSTIVSSPTLYGSTLVCGATICGTTSVLGTVMCSTGLVYGTGMRGTGNQSIFINDGASVLADNCSSAACIASSSGRIMYVRYTVAPSACLGVTDHFISFCSADALIGSIKSCAAGAGICFSASFTGTHDTTIEPHDFDCYEPGMIVETTGRMCIVSVGDSRPIVRLTTKRGSNTVYGIYSDKELATKDSGISYGFKEGDMIYKVNQVGEGAVLVTNINGEINNGDYIETSDIKGLGQLQFGHPEVKTMVAKAIGQVCWDCITDYVTYCGKQYKKALVPVIYKV